MEFFLIGSMSFYVKILRLSDNQVIAIPNRSEAGSLTPERRPEHGDLLQIAR